MAKEIAMATLKNLIEEYLDGPKQLRNAIAGMTREQALARPIAGKWSTLEVVAYIASRIWPTSSRSWPTA
jgi:hypothetical protein